MAKGGKKGRAYLRALLELVRPIRPRACPFKFAPRVPQLEHLPYIDAESHGEEGTRAHMHNMHVHVHVQHAGVHKSLWSEGWQEGVAEGGEQRGGRRG